MHQFVQIGWTCTVSNFCFTTCSNFILTTSEICQTEHTIETKANVITHDARIFHKLHLPPMMRTFPSTELEVVKKHYMDMICMAFQKSAYQMWTQKTLAPIICVVFFLPGSGNCGASKLDVAAAHSQRQKHQYFEYGLVWVNYGLNTL